MRFLPALITRNWKLKLAALSLAILLWTSLRLEAMDRQRVESVPVRVQLNDPQWAVGAEPEPATVAVEFSGPARQLFSLRIDRPTVMVPVDQVSSGDTTVLIRPDWVRLANRPGVTVEDVEPRSVRLSFEPITQAGVPLALRTEGSLPDGVALAAPISLQPDFARVSGPAGQLEELDSIPLEPLELGEIDEAVTRTVPVDTSGLTGTVISPGAVDVVVVVEQRVQRTVNGIPVVPPQAWDQVSMEPEALEVVLSGARSRVAAVDPNTLRVEVSGGGSRPAPGDTVMVPVRVRGTPALVDARPARDSVSVVGPPRSLP